MRVALVHPFSWPDVRRGGERYLHDLAWYLRTRGAAVDLVVGGRPGVTDGPDGRVVQVRHLPRLARGGLTTTDTFGLAAFVWLRRHRYDVVHALTPTAALASSYSGQRTVYTVLGHPSRASTATRRWDLPLFRRTLRRVDAPLALSDSAADAVTALAGVRPRVVPPGVRTNLFPTSRPHGGPPRLLFASDAADRRKGLDLLLQAMPSVLDRHPDARLVLGGGGATAWAFDRLDPADRDRVALATDDIGAGSLDDVPGRYADATLTVLPSIDEAFGLVLVESLSCARPVVALRSGGPAEIVDEGTGRLAAPGDPAALAEAVCAVIAMADDPATPGRCVERARRWDWEAAVGPLHMTVYADVQDVAR